MPAINYDEDTEFNAALRAHGIIPPRASTSRSPSPVLAPPSPTLSDLSDISLNEDDGLSRAVLEQYREERMREERVAEGNRKFGRVYPIGKGDYTKEVNEDSKLDLVGEGMPGEGTGVVCYLFKDSLPDCKLLSPILAKVAALYPSTKFVSIVSDHCIENYPDKNCPTLLIYRKGDMMGQVVGLGGMGGQNVTVADVERILFAFRALDLHLKVTNTTVAQFSSRTPATKKAKDSDDDESDEDETFVGGGRQKSYGSKSGIRSSRRDEDEDDEYDL